MSEAQQQRKRRRQPKQAHEQQNNQRMNKTEMPPNSMQMQNDLMAYQAWLAEQLQYTAYLQQNGPVAQYMNLQQRQPQPHCSNGPQNRPRFNQNRGPEQQRGKPQKPAVKPNTPARRSVATWTCFEPDGPPRSYFSERPWKSQVRCSATCSEDQCPKIFRGRTVTASAPAMPAPPESRCCDDCGGMIVHEAAHKRSRLHREAVELDVSLICSRIRRDPAFAAAVIAAARECVENTGVEDSGHEDDDDEDGPPGKRARQNPPAADDEFEFLEGDVFRRAPADKKAN